MRGALVLAALLLAGCAPAAPGEATEAIVGGTAETADQDPNVVAVIGQVPGSKTATLCTGSVVSPHVVLTAAHCLIPSEVGTGAQFFIYPGPDLTTATNAEITATKVKEVDYDSSFSEAEVQNGNDVGVVILDDALMVTPLPMNRDGLSKSLDGQPARLIGYGQTSGTDTTGATAGQRRTVTTTLIEFDDLFAEVGNGGMTVCNGDSGGPALMMIDGVEQIVGITSFGDAACDTFGYDTRIDKYADSWVQPYLDEYDPGVIPDHHGGGCDLAPGARGGGAWGLALVLLALALFKYARSTDA